MKFSLPVILNPKKILAIKYKIKAIGLINISVIKSINKFLGIKP